MAASTLNEIVDFLNEKFKPEQAVTPETPLKDTVLLDSIRNLEVVIFLEERFGIALTRRDILKHFDTPASIANLVEERATN